MQRYTVHFTGRVQGVGFRYTTVNLAAKYDKLAGYVRNLADGRVELVVEGPGATIEKLLADIARHMSGHIQHTAIDKSPARGDLGDEVTVRY